MSDTKGTQLIQELSALVDESKQNPRNGVFIDNKTAEYYLYAVLKYGEACANLRHQIIELHNLVINTNKAMDILTGWRALNTNDQKVQEDYFEKFGSLNRNVDLLITRIQQIINGTS